MLQYKTVSPVGDRVYVKVNVSEEKTSSGLLLPVSSQKKPTQGEIVAAGTAKAVKVSNGFVVTKGSRHMYAFNNWEHEPLPCVQNGDKVVYSKYAGTELKMQGGDFVLLKVRHIPLSQS